MWYISLSFYILAFYIVDDHLLLETVWVCSYSFSKRKMQGRLCSSGSGFFQLLMVLVSMYSDSRVMSAAMQR